MERWPAILVIRDTFVWELGLCLTFPIRSDLVFGDRINILLQFPCTVIVVEIMPLAEVFHITVGRFAMRYDAFHIAISLEILLFALLV